MKLPACLFKAKKYRYFLASFISNLFDLFSELKHFYITFKQFDNEPFSTFLYRKKCIAIVFHYRP